MHVLLVCFPILADLLLLVLLSGQNFPTETCMPPLRLRRQKMTCTTRTMDFVCDGLEVSDRLDERHMVALLLFRSELGGGQGIAAIIENVA